MFIQISEKLMCKRTFTDFKKYFFQLHPEYRKISIVSEVNKNIRFRTKNMQMSQP